MSSLLGLVRLVVGLAGGEFLCLLVSPSLLEVWFWWACSGFWFFALAPHRRLTFFPF